MNKDKILEVIKQYWYWDDEPLMGWHDEACIYIMYIDSKEQDCLCNLEENQKIIEGLFEEEEECPECGGNMAEGCKFCAACNGSGKVKRDSGDEKSIITPAGAVEERKSHQSKIPERMEELEFITIYDSEGTTKEIISEDGIWEVVEKISEILDYLKGKEK